MPERRLEAHLSQWVVQTLTRLMATYAIAQGVMIILGGSRRWQGKALATALSFPGAPDSWGLIIGGLGILTIVGTFNLHAKLPVVGLFGIAAWSLFFAGSQVAVAIHEQIATTGIPTYIYLAVSACVLAVAYWRSHP